jgi:hypothetical protein
MLPSFLNSIKSNNQNDYGNVILRDGFIGIDILILD